MTGSPESELRVKSGAGSPSSTGKRPSVRRAVGVVRVSRVGDRDGDRFVSPREQTERIAVGRGARRAQARRHVRGARRLGRRTAREAPGPPSGRRAGRGRRGGRRRRRVLRPARSLAHRAGRGRRADRAGRRRDPRRRRGGGPCRHRLQWLSSTMLGLVAEYHRRSTSERTADAKRRAVVRGVPPFPNVPPGYRKRKDGTLEPDENAPRSPRLSGCAPTARP